MSPQYTTKTSSHSKSHSSFAKAQKMLEEEDPRFRGLDRMLARAYIELQRKRAQQQRAGLFMPRYVSASRWRRYHKLTRFSFQDGRM